MHFSLLRGAIKAIQHEGANDIPFQNFLAIHSMQRHDVRPSGGDLSGRSVLPRKFHLRHQQTVPLGKAAQQLCIRVGRGNFSGRTENFDAGETAAEKRQALLKFFA